MQGEKSFDTGELTLTYLEAGSGAPMVALHGLSSRKEQWTTIIPRLASRWHVYVPDLRGHGTSGHPADGYANADYARDILAFLKQIGEPAVLIGHSLGAMAALVVAADYSEHLRALILLDPPLSTWNTHIDTRTPPGIFFQLIYDLNSGALKGDDAVARVRALMPGMDDHAIRGMIAGMAHVAPGTVKAALDDAMWRGRDLPRDLQSIRCPTLLIHADIDQGGAMRPEDIELFKANCPSAAVVRIPGADHGLKMMTEPEIALGHINDFLASV
ncbi:MAG TPA: alpha/beta hydrolase [Phototrophicaceae bacterium]|nr:alpha/beta hydrolase [Phototrophicaceae bacterium]